MSAWFKRFFHGMCVVVLLFSPHIHASDLARFAPEKIAGYKLIDKHVYPDSQAGVTFRYAEQTGESIDVYVYPVTEVYKQKGITPAEIEIKSFEYLIPVLIKKGMLDSASIKKKVSISHKGWSGEGLVLNVIRKQRTGISFIFVVAKEGTLIKLRLTSNTLQQSDTDTILKWLRDWIDATAAGKPDNAA